MSRILIVIGSVWTLGGCLWIALTLVRMVRNPAVLSGAAGREYLGAILWTLLLTCPGVLLLLVAGYLATRSPRTRAEMDAVGEVGERE